MKVRAVLFILLAALVFSGLYAQSQEREWTDAELARQYAQWARKAIEEDRWAEALAALERAADFAGVSSDISYLLAVARSHEGKSRKTVLESLDTALQTNRWLFYSENHALLLKSEQLIAMREYASALSVLEQTAESADAVMRRLAALRGLALGKAPNSDPAQALARFRSLMLSAMDRYPRDTRPLRIFFDYARNRKPQPSDLPSGDLDLLELALRRLPFLLETDPDLAWIAAPFMRDTEAARRYVSSYRAGGLSNNKDSFEPNVASIPSALNLGLISDIDAVEELLYGDSFILNKNVITDVYNLLRSEEGRNLFTQKLLSSSLAFISSDEDSDGFMDSLTQYYSGVIQDFGYDSNQSNYFDLRILMDKNGVPVSAGFPLAGESSLIVSVFWERYPSVEMVTLDAEVFEFRPADFQFAPVTFTELGGSQNYAGLAYPVLSYQYKDITRRSLVSFCVSMTRPSAEFDGAEEQIFFERGMPLRSVETLDGKQISVTEFENGFPVVQRVDMDLDGRMETVRHFRRPSPDLPPPDTDGTFDFRRMIESSESDWSGDGKHKTREVYLQDGSVVYSWDMDGSGVMNYSETKTGKEQ
ncbi:MAG: ATP-binding protein [Treponema sp.]|jgi:tetratricopeptide (TPR) repeat protein|nr:ATP-binding protein [Treponema sp.]